jgi:hypothetical protein
VEITVDQGQQSFRFQATASSKIDFPQAPEFHGRYLLTENHLLTSSFLSLS